MNAGHSGSLAVLAAVLLVGCARRDDHTTPAADAASSQAQTASSGDAAPVTENTPPLDPVLPSNPQPPDAPMTPAEKARALAGIAQLQGLVRRRATLGRESDDACAARIEKDTAQIEALENQIGQRNLDTKTRFSSRAPNLDATVETFVVACIGCVDLDEPEVDRHECGMAATALGDLAERLRAEK